MFVFLAAPTSNHHSEIDDSPTTFARLQAAMLGACERQQEWPAKLAAGIYAGLEFAVANPEAARSLVIEGAQADRPGDGDSADTRARLRDMLAAVAPRNPHLPASTDTALVGGVIAVLAGHLRRDRLDRLLATGPDLVIFVLTPYLGYTEARRWALRDAPASWSQ